MTKKKSTANTLSFTSAKVMVVGDVMLDEYISGTTIRISPEAPVPVVKLNNTSFNLGGAGNVAANLASLGVKTTLVGLVGCDKQAEEIRDIAEKQNIDGFLLETDQPTVTKTRIVAQRQQVVRLDREELFLLNRASLSNYIHTVCRLAEMQEVVIVSDYRKGSVHPQMLSDLIVHCNHLGIPVLVDPKHSDWRMYAGATLLTPNLRELSETAGCSIANDDKEITSIAREILKNTGLKRLVVTRSEKGISLIDAKQAVHFPAQAHEVFDVSGAGDTVIAVLAAAMAKNWLLDQAVALANVAAGTVVLHNGTVPVKLEELKKSWNI